MIPMVIRVKGLFGMNMEQRERALDIIDRAYKDAKARNVPLVVGNDIDVLWPVDRWEHKVKPYDGHKDLFNIIKAHQADGWQVCSSDSYKVVFKRPARDDNE